MASKAAESSREKSKAGRGDGQKETEKKDRRTDRYAPFDHGDSEDDEDQEEMAHTQQSRGGASTGAFAIGASVSAKTSAKSNDRSRGTDQSGIVSIPASVVPVDDAALDDECLSFLNKMSTRLPVPKL